MVDGFPHVHDPKLSKCERRKTGFMIYHFDDLISRNSMRPFEYDPSFMSKYLGLLDQLAQIGTTFGFDIVL